MKTLTKAAKAFDPNTLQAALEHDPERTRAAVKNLIGVLSSAMGIAVTFDAVGTKAIDVKADKQKEEGEVLEYLIAAATDMGSAPTGSTSPATWNGS